MRPVCQLHSYPVKSAYALSLHLSNLLTHCGSGEDHGLLATWWNPHIHYDQVGRLGYLNILAFANWS